MKIDRIIINKMFLIQFFEIANIKKNYENPIPKIILICRLRFFKYEYI